MALTHVYDGRKFDQRAERQVDIAWEKFIANKGEVPEEISVRNEVLTSWQRCLSEGVDPNIHRAPLLASRNHLAMLREKNRELLESAKEVVNQGTFLQELGGVLFLTDAAGVNLCIVGDEGTIAKANSINLIAGSRWSEEESGSNAVGTALATGRYIQVHGEEHFCVGFKPWTCTASVVHDPYDGTVLGAIDLSGLRNSFDRYHLPLVVSWASQIEARLAQRSIERWSRLEQAVGSRATGQAQDHELLFDSFGRLVRTGKNVSGDLERHGIPFIGTQTMRLSFEQYGGKPLCVEADPPDWLSPDWIDVVKDGSEILGFRVVVETRTSNRSRVSLNMPQAEQEPSPFDRILGGSTQIRSAVEKAKRIAAAPIPVLLLGETGVGKEIFARSIHDADSSHDGPFVDLNCGGLSKELLAGELFGHVDGAFTGAKRGGMIGKIEAANGGTLFLDEIGEMPLDMQPMLLRVLQERQIYRLGEVKPRKVNFRLIAATNRDLSQEVREGRFRQDLFFRISTFTLKIPSLRERLDDIPALAQYFFEQIKREHSIKPKRIDDNLIRFLQSREWPGNVRELASTLEYMCFLSTSDVLSIEDGVSDDVAGGHGNGLGQQGLCSLEEMEKDVIRKTIKECGGNISAVARILGVARSTLYLKIKQYNLQG